ncbi:thioredoxin-like protein [Spinellus fusiger]|nr:thioredoxin-like protein [Spinellus fusiger]
MNALRTLTQATRHSLKGFAHQRTFHSAQTCWSSASVVANEKNFSAVALEAKNPVIVDFHATWCAPCKILGPVLSKAVAEHPNVTLVQVDTDDNQDLAAKYEIHSLPTVVAFYNGQEVNRFMGMISSGAIAKFVQEHAENKE